MGEALVPGAGDALLFGAGFGGVTGDGVEFLGGEFGSVEIGGEGGGGVALDAALDPDLRGAVVLPVGEEADAVAAEEDVVEVVLELVEGEVFVDGLRDLEGGQEVECDGGDDAEGAEMDDGAEEGVAVFVRGRWCGGCRRR